MASAGRFWWEGCLVILGVLYLYVGFLGTSAWDLTRVLGILGGVLLIVSTTSRKKWPLLSLVVVGAVPLAVADWWSIVVPLLAASSLGVAFLRIRNLARIK